MSAPAMAGRIVKKDISAVRRVMVLAFMVIQTPVMLKKYPSLTISCRASA